LFLWSKVQWKKIKGILGNRPNKPQLRQEGIKKPLDTASYRKTFRGNFITALFTHTQYDNYTILAYCSKHYCSKIVWSFQCSNPRLTIKSTVNCGNGKFLLWQHRAMLINSTNDGTSYFEGDKMHQEQHYHMYIYHMHQT
jgi:hypothetical protein